MMSDYEAKDTFQKLLLQTFFEKENKMSTRLDEMVIPVSGSVAKVRKQKGIA